MGKNLISALLYLSFALVVIEHLVFAGHMSPQNKDCISQHPLHVGVPGKEPCLMGYNYMVHALCLLSLLFLLPSCHLKNKRGHTLQMAEQPAEGAPVPEDRTAGFSLRLPVGEVSFYPV